VKLAVTDFGGPPDGPLLLLGPSLGTCAAAVWSPCVPRLTARFHAVGWDFPGHGRSTPEPAFDVATVAGSVLQIADELGAATFCFAGDSLGGCVGLELLLSAPSRVVAATLLCTAARIRTPDVWTERAALVRASGTAALLDSAAERWFSPRYAGDPQPLLDDLSAIDDASYAAACDALAAFDLRDRLTAITTPLTAVAGVDDVVVPVDDVRRLAAEARHGRFVALDGVGHLAPIEAPFGVAELIIAAADASDMWAAGMRVRRAVLGDEYVDRAVANTTEFTADFQDLITRYAWGDIWTRPGLDRRSRSLITLTALIAHGHHDEFALHVRAALRNGVTPDEIRELVLHVAIYCGVPTANTAFRIAQQVLDEVRGD
jgi:3-oxoadipate enol-lactonase/4-carboxymuconolactone decarboxylase